MTTSNRLSVALGSRDLSRSMTRHQRSMAEARVRLEKVLTAMNWQVGTEAQFAEALDAYNKAGKEPSESFKQAYKQFAAEKYSLDSFRLALKEFFVDYETQYRTVISVTNAVSRLSAELMTASEPDVKEITSIESNNPFITEMELSTTKASPEAAAEGEQKRFVDEHLSNHPEQPPLPTAKVASRPSF